jgi:uncharacterized protein involved in type VI secretion and phage assembly
MTSGSPLAVERTARHRISGMQVGIVTDNNDPEKHYRVKIRYPALDNGGKQGGEQSYWARMATVGAGKDRGIFFLPEVNDEVVVGFLDGDMQHPVVLGALWNKEQPVYENNDAWGGANNKRTFKSRSGHFLEFDDTDGAMKVTLKTQKGHVVCLDDDGGTIDIKTSDGSHWGKFDEGGKVTLSTSGDMLIDVTGTLQVNANEINTDSKANTNMKAGANWNGKASSNFELKGGGTGTLQSGATMTIKGSTVNIN